MVNTYNSFVVALYGRKWLSDKITSNLSITAVKLDFLLKVEIEMKVEIERQIFYVCSLMKFTM